jgi:hypothetical protein
MNSTSQPHPSDTLDIPLVGGVGSRTTPLDLDTMAAIAVEAGQDALHGRGAQAPFESSLTLFDIPTADGDGRRGTATRLYQACLQGATDPATD